MIIQLLVKLNVKEIAIVLLWKKIKHAFCQKCKEGYFDINGNCASCSDISQGYSKCSYQKNKDNENFTCFKCINNEYNLTDKGVCEKCSFPNCQKCHYNDKLIVECDKCNEGYYKNLTGDCVECRDYYFEGRYCKICSDNDTDIDYDSCFCDSGYTKLENGSCFKCSDNCDICEYNIDLNITECKECYYNYALNSDKKCIHCGDDCSEWELNIEDNPICKRCYSGLFLENAQYHWKSYNIWHLFVTS